MLNPASSPYYEETKRQVLLALAAYPGGLQAGGGITAQNAQEYLNAGASHVIVTSYVFRDGELQWDNLKCLADTVGRGHVVIDLSCRKRDGDFYIVTDRWQKFTDVRLSHDILGSISEYCDEFLVHGVDVEGLSSGIDEELIRILKGFGECPVTYAGGIGSYDDLERFREMTEGKLDFTIGSALDLFGGKLAYERLRHIM